MHLHGLWPLVPLSLTLGLRVDADAPPNPLTLGDVATGELGASSLFLVRFRVRVTLGLGLELGLGVGSG